MYILEYPAITLSLYHPVWLMRNDQFKGAAAVVDGDQSSCTNVYQPFWVVDIGFTTVVDEVTISYSPNDLAVETFQS